MNNIRLRNISNARQTVRVRHGQSFTVEPGAFFHVEADLAKTLLKMEAFEIWKPSPQQVAEGKHPGGCADALAQLGMELEPLPEGKMGERKVTKPAAKVETK